MSYIEREKAKQRLVHDYAYAAANILDEIPAADVVEVVRCGQCKHATDDIMVEGVCYCHKIQQGMFVDGFCNYGERKCDNA